MRIYLIILLATVFIVGVSMTFGVRFADFKKLQSKIKPKDLIHGKKSLKQTVRQYSDAKQSFLQREMSSLYDALKITRNEKRFGSLIVKSCLLAAVGAAVGIYMRNIVVIPLLAGVLFLIPIWRQKMYINQYQKYISMQLETSVSLITTAYIRSGDIVKSVEENINNIDEIIRPAFEEFVAESKINANLKKCIRNLQSKIPNSIFYEWCDLLIKTYENSELRDNLVSIAGKFSTVRIVQDDLDVEIAEIKKEYSFLIGIQAAAYVGIYFINRDWFAYYGTLAGKIVVGFSVFAVAFCIARLISLLAPIKFER